MAPEAIGRVILRGRGDVNVLGIESSCDDTAAAVVGASGVLADVVHTQVEHAPFGGVVPELASRAHIEKIGWLVRQTLSEANLDRPDAVAATAGPGLIGAVLVGLCYAKALAAGWGVPFVAVNHLEGHMLAPLLEEPAPEWPFIALVVSGGHTAIYRCEALGRYEVLGETIDDAAGEAFDKVARMLGLGHPGGPRIDAGAARGACTVALPRPLPGDLDFSFSGLKTAVRLRIQAADRASDDDICASFQRAVVDCLLHRVQRASARTGIRRVVVSGGVAANRELRERLMNAGLEVFLPPKRRCTDNGAMIANAGRMHILAGRRDSLAFRARPSWSPADLER